MWFYSGRMASSNCQKRLYWYAARFICANIVIVRRPARNNHKFRLKMSLYSIFIQQTRAHNAISFENYNAVNSNFFCFVRFVLFLGDFVNREICEQDHKLCKININQNRDDFLIFARKSIPLYRRFMWMYGMEAFFEIANYAC